MNAPLLLGFAAGVGAVLIVRGIFPGRVPLATALRRLEAPQPNGASGVADRATAAPILESELLRRLLPNAETESFRTDLRIVGRSPERHAIDRFIAACVLGGLPVAVRAVLSLGMVHISWGPVLVAASGLALAGFFVPSLTLRSEAERRRREFRHALAAFLDLVVIILAGGGGTETALSDAANAGNGWAFAEIRRALAAARLAGEPPWVALSRVGDEIGVEDLAELAASVGLAGEHGARVRMSLATKASSMREHQLAQVQADAEQATEQMSLPTVLMLFGFLAFVLYPALQFVLQSL